MASDRDLELATAHLLADGLTHTKAELDALAELLAKARAEERAAVVAWLRNDVEDDAALLEADAIARGEHLALGTVPHAGECALCRAPFVRTETGAKPSCACGGA